MSERVTSLPVPVVTLAPLVLLSQWTTCVFAGSCVVAAVWFYFVTPPAKQMVYAPVVLTGSGASGLMVLVLSFVTEVLWEDKVGRAFKRSLLRLHP